MTSLGDSRLEPFVRSELIHGSSPSMPLCLWLLTTAVSVVVR